MRDNFYESSNSAACGHRGQKRMQPDKCVQGNTLRFLFLNSVIPARCGTRCWEPIRGGGPWNKRAHAHKRKKQIPDGPLPVPLWWSQGGVAAWGAPLESGTDGRKETSHWSRVTTFCLFFFLLMLITCEDLVLLHPFIKISAYLCVHPIIFNAPY